MVAFLITRNSIVKAMRNGITADQICSFLEEYSENDVLMKEADAKLERSNPGLHMNGKVEDLNIRRENGVYYKICRGVEESKSQPRTTRVMPMAPSSAVTAS